MQTTFINTQKGKGIKTVQTQTGHALNLKLEFSKAVLPDEVSNGVIWQHCIICDNFLR